MGIGVGTGSVGNAGSDGAGPAETVGTGTVGAGMAWVGAITGAVACGFGVSAGSGTAGALVVSEGAVVGFD